MSRKPKSQQPRSDFALCDGEGCERAAECLRHMLPPAGLSQVRIWIPLQERGAACDQHWPMDKSLDAGGAK